MRIRKFLYLLFQWITIAGFSNCDGDTLQINTLFAVPDGIGNIFIINNRNTIMKIDSGMNILASRSLIDYGIASSIECNGGTEVIIYCYNTGRLIIFDNFLKEKNDFDLSRVINPKPNLVCMSKTGWWVYDETSLKVCSYKGNFQKSYTLPDLEMPQKEMIKICEIKNSQPVFLFSDNSVSIRSVPLSGIGEKRDFDFKFESTPCLNFNTSELYGYFADTLSLVRTSTEIIKCERIVTGLNFPKVNMVIKSYHTLFFIFPEIIIKSPRIY